MPGYEPGAIEVISDIRLAKCLQCYDYCIPFPDKPVEKTVVWIGEGYIHTECMNMSFYWSVVNLRFQSRELMMLFWESIKIPQLVEWLSRKLR